jgi:Mn-containing catalase
LLNFPWTADYLKITGDIGVDLRSNVAAEARAKIVYERLINFCDDPGTKDALQFLMTREITHMKAFMAALESMGNDPLEVGEIPPTPGIVNKFFNDSSGQGDEGETDERGPWNEGDGMEYVDGPAKPIAEGTAEEVVEEIVRVTRRGAPSRSAGQPRSRRMSRTTR